MRAPLPRKFYARGAEIVARELLGKILVRKWRGKWLQARIIETEAYVGPHDLACHASKGRTARTDVMFGPPGHAYVYFIYGMYDMLNVVTSKLDDPQAVLIRALEPLVGFPPRTKLCGPGKLTREMHITRKLNRHDLCSGDELFICNGPAVRDFKTSPRIGVDYAGDWKDKELRFFEAVRLE